MRLRLPSLPGYFDYERMVNDDKLAVYCLCETVCVSERFFVYVSVFVCAFILYEAMSHRTVYFDYAQVCQYREFKTSASWPKE